MYSVRIEIDENQDKINEPYRLPKDFISYLTHSVSNTQTQLKIIERLLFRLARISYETYNISHFDRELFEISDDLQSIYLDENRSHFHRDEEINRAKMDDLLHFGLLLETSVRLSPLSFSDLYSQKRMLKFSIREYQKKGIRVKLYDRLKTYIWLSDFCVMFSNIFKMRHAVNAFCSKLFQYELDTFSINSKSLIDPIFLIKDIRRNEWGPVYNYLSKRKFLYIDADEMKDTIRDLAIEYTSLCEPKNESEKTSTEKPELLSSVVLRDQYNLNNLSNVKIQESDSIGIDESIEEINGKKALFDILQKAGVGICDSGFLLIRLNKEEDKDPTYRTVCFTTRIIYDYLDSCKRKIPQECLLSGIYLVQEENYEKYRAKKIQLEEILNNSENETNIQSMRRKFTDKAIGNQRSAKGYELEQRKKILKVIETDYSQFLLNMHIYSQQIRFYKNVVRNIQENLPVVLD